MNWKKKHISIYLPVNFKMDKCFQFLVQKWKEVFVYKQCTKLNPIKDWRAGADNNHQLIKSTKLDSSQKLQSAHLSSFRTMQNRICRASLYNYRPWVDPNSKSLSVIVVAFLNQYRLTIMAEPVVITDGFLFLRDICGRLEFGLKSIKSRLKQPLMGIWGKGSETLSGMRPCLRANEPMRSVIVAFHFLLPSQCSSLYTDFHL